MIPVTVAFAQMRAQAGNESWETNDHDTYRFGALRMVLTPSTVQIEEVVVNGRAT